MEKPYRFSLRTLFGVVTFAAVGCAVLAKPSENGAWSLGVVVFTLLAWGGIVAVDGQSTNRAFWLGFIATGWGYMAFEHFAGTPGRLPASLVINMLARMEFDSGGKFVTLQLFEQIAYFACTAMTGFVGGLVAHHLRLRRERERLAVLNE